MKRLAKSTLPSSRPRGGMTTSSTSEVMILPNAAPMTTPTARSTTLPLTANSLNSFHIRSNPPFDPPTPVDQKASSGHVRPVVFVEGEGYQAGGDRVAT